MYVRAALLALALGHASATTKDDDALAALHAADDAQLLAEVARRNLAAGPPQRLLQELQYSFKYECDCERDCPTVFRRKLRGHSRERGFSGTDEGSIACSWESQ